MPPLLEIRSLEAGYGPFKVLRGLSAHVDQGENVGLFGPNGHGKTTLFETISGLVKPTAGRITFDGRDITGRAPWDIVEAGLIHVAQGSRLFGKMTVDETLDLGAFAKRARKDRVRNKRFVLEVFPRLAERRTQLCGTLSGGERQMLNLAVGMMSSPRLLILDEPTLGLSPKLKASLGASIRDIAASGVQMLVVEQDIDFLLRLATRLYLINHGEVTKVINVADDSFGLDSIMQDYFGVSGAS